MTKLLTSLCILVAVAVVALLLEVASTSPRYALKDAIIINVQDDPPWGYLGEEKRTLVQFSDGYRKYTAGDLGKTGEHVKAWRHCGTTSIFGWFSEKAD